MTDVNQSPRTREDGVSIQFEDYLHQYCKVEFFFSREPERTMNYDGVVEAVIRGGSESDHLVMNVHYAGRVPIELETIKSIEVLPSETRETPPA